MNIGQYPDLGNPFNLGLLDPQETPDLEFMTKSFDYGDPAPEILEERDKQITQWLNDGWQIDEHLSCGYIMTIVFSREKETEET